MDIRCKDGKIFRIRLKFFNIYSNLLVFMHIVELKTHFGFKFGNLFLIKRILITKCHGPLGRDIPYRV